MIGNQSPKKNLYKVLRLEKKIVDATLEHHPNVNIELQ